MKWIKKETYKPKPKNFLDNGRLINKSWFSRIKKEIEKNKMCLSKQNKHKNQNSNLGIL